MKATPNAARSKKAGESKSTKIRKRGKKQTNKALYRNALDNMLEGCQIISHDWQYLYLNSTAELHNRRPNQELLGNTYMEIWPGIEATAVFAEIKRCMEERVSIQFENKVIYPDGAIGWFNLSIRPIPEGVLILSIDITEYKKTEKQFLQMNRLYATLSQVNQLIVRVRNRDDLYQSICDIAVEFGDFSLAWIGLLHEPSGEIKPVAANGLDVKQWPFPTINIRRGKLKKSLVATAIRTSQVVTSEDVQVDQRTQGMRTLIEGYDYHSLAAIPFQLKGKTIGVVALVSRDTDFFKAEVESHLLEEMGLDISFALAAIETDARRKEVEQALLEAEERFAKAFYQSPIGIALVDLTDFTIRDVNNTLLDMMGLERKQIVGQNVLLLDLQVDPEVRAAIGKELEEHGLFRNKEVQLRLPSGELRHVLNSGVRVMIRGKPHNLALIQDITERKRTEEMLRESEQKFSILFEKSSFAASLSRLPDGVIVNVNKAFERAFGYTKQEIIGKTSLELGINPDSEGRARILAALNEDGSARNQELTLHTKSGEARIFSVNIDVVDIGNQKYILNTTQDVTEQKRAEEQVQHQLKHLNALRMIDTAISSSFDLHVILDIVLQQVLEQLEVDASALLLFHPQINLLEYAASLGFRSDALRYTKLRLGEGYASQAVLARKTIYIPALMETDSKLAHALQSANEEFVDYYGSPMIAKGEVKGVLEIYHRSHLKAGAEWLNFLETLAGQAAIAIDNTQLFDNLQHSNLTLEQRVVERTAELHETNVELERANRAKDEFLANMSHELRTPLTSILGLSESLLEQRRGSLNDHQQRSLEIIESSGQHLLQLINDILDLSKIEAGKIDFYPQPVSVDEICRSSLSFVKAQATKKSITVTYVQDISIPKIFADPRRLKQILVNLLSNAVKFTLEKGDVILQVNTDLEQDLIKFSVIDNGIGISQEDLQRLFQPFVQVDSGLNRQHEGTGLGLTLVQKLTDLHGGSVQVESEPGKGSRFTIKLPCLQEEVAKLEKLESRATLPISEWPGTTAVPVETPAYRGVILLADDNMPNILMIGEYLEDRGYEVVAAHDGLEAIQKAEAIHPDIILMDIQMPSMNGLEAMAQLRGNPQFATTPIIALTALAMPGDRERSLLAGANEYMSKPVSLKALREKIENLLEGRSGR